MEYWPESANDENGLMCFLLTLCNVQCSLVLTTVYKVHVDAIYFSSIYGWEINIIHVSYTSENIKAFY